MTDMVSQKVKNDVNEVKYDYGICLYSKHTGEHTYLGSKFKTMEDLQKYVDANVCSRCNRYEVIYVPEGHTWVNRTIGFISKDRLKKEMQLEELTEKSIAYAKIRDNEYRYLTERNKRLCS